jgi:hypothetical protein
VRRVAILSAMEIAEQLLARVAETYAKCATYADEGSLTTVFATGTHPWNRRTERILFRTAFDRGGRFLFEYRVQGVGPETEWTRGAMWQDATGVQTWSTISGVLATARTLSESLAAFAGISGGTSYFALSLLRPDMAHAPRLPSADLSMYEAYPADEARPCLIVSGKDWRGKMETLRVQRESSLVVRLETEMVFDKAQFASQLASMKASLAAMSANDEHRPMMEKAVAEHSSREHRDFRTESTTIWRPRINVDIPDDAFRFEPPK